MLSISNARASTKHSTVTTLTDQALIAFEIEHERNRLREELQRLQSAQDDAQRSLEILEFMSFRMDNDPLVNPLNNNNINTTKSNIQQPISGENDLPPMLEYLPSHTIIRCANKQLRKISNIKVGDKILSLCINTYPNGKSRNSYLPKPTKRTSQITINSTNGYSTHTHTHTHTNGINKKRERSRTTVNTSVPFMLPPPVQRPSQSNININNNHNHIKGKLPRKSMPSMYRYNEHNNKSPNLIAQSVTQPIHNESLMLTPQGSKSPKIRRKTVGNIHRHSHYNNNNNNNNNNNT
eukprot:895457_1